RDDLLREWLAAERRRPRLRRRSALAPVDVEGRSIWPDREAVIIAPARDPALDRETEVIDVVRDIQESLARVGVRSALLHQPDPIEEHDVDLAVGGVWRRVWPAITSAAAAHGYRPVL